MNNKEPIRLAILALIVGVFFGINQFIPKDKTFDVISIELSLKVLSDVFFQIVLIVFILYLAVLALNFGYNNKFRPKIFEFLYDFGVTLTIMLIFIGFSLIGLIWLVVSFPDYINPGWKTNLILLILMVIGAIFFYKNLEYYVNRIRNPFSSL